MLEDVRDVILYIPNKIINHFETFKALEAQVKKDAGIKEAYRRRLNCIKITAEQNHYGNEECYKRKIIELATTPIENKF